MRWPRNRSGGLHFSTQNISLFDMHTSCWFKWTAWWNVSEMWLSCGIWHNGCILEKTCLSSKYRKCQLSVSNVLEPYQSRDLQCTFFHLPSTFKWRYKDIKLHSSSPFLLFRVQTDLTDNWTSSTQPPPSPSTKRWNNNRGEWCTKSFTISSICLTRLHNSCFNYEGIHIVPSLFLWSKCLSWHYVTGKSKHVRCVAISV